MMQAKKKVLWSQHLASGTLSIVLFTVGLGNGWSSPYLAKLSMMDNIDGIPRASDDELLWVASLMNIGRIFGAVAGAVAQDTIGRKMGLFFCGFPMLSGWICIAMATSVHWLYAARILCGFSMGIVWTTMSHYLAEIADPQIRGSLVLWNITVQSVGIFVGNLMGPYMSMKLFAYISIFATLMFLVLFPLIPDSPHRHLKMGNLDKAEESLKWFRRKQDVKQELNEIKDYLSKSDASFKEKLDEFRQKQSLKNFGLMFLMNVFLYFCAFNVINNYMEIIVSASRVTIIAPSTLVSINGFFAIISGMAMSLTSLGIHFMLLKCHYDPVSLNLLPCICLTGYTLSYSAGMGCIPSTLVGELFSPNLKSVASLMFSGTAALFSTLSTITFLPLQNLIGPSYLYWFYSAGIYASSAYYYFCLTETKGQSLQSIQIRQKKEAES
ncbi:facilitated trehalose transporter Tret1-like isoform X2 [Phymastichus coffea]|uniref:facilitated trehalose transporter Tret1-like isoform X2 n=1 Tax=Phymastichus coffea TaxID=108790 RepID=UPI00273CC596|nr:facilitated trehalose transporter Tret1-like isoform X2 [Phymastichus coffea]